MEELTQYLDPAQLTQLITTLGAYVPKLLLALAILIIGFKLANRMSRMTATLIEKQVAEPSLSGFLKSLVSIVLKVLVILTVAGMIGVEVASFIALIGAAGLAIGVSLQGTLSNFAGGVMLLFFQPFKVGERIRAQGHTGTVEQISIVATILRTPQNERVIIPNGPLANGVIENITGQGTLRLDLVFGIGYGDNIDEARTVLEQIFASNPLILNTPEPIVFVDNLGDSSVDLGCHVHVACADALKVKFALNEEIKKAFDENSISIPYPHQEVYLHKMQE